MLDPVEACGDQLTRFENLEVRRARDVVGVADVDDRLRARERKPEVNLQR